MAQIEGHFIRESIDASDREPRIMRGPKCGALPTAKADGEAAGSRIVR